MAGRKKWIENAARLAGLDWAIAYTFSARICQILGSTGTVLLIVRFLSPVEQGYYYTLLSLVSLQMVFELGFSFVIQQLAAHECVHLAFGPDGSVSGDSAAHARLALALQLSVRWYSVAALALGMILAPLGMLFFAPRATAATAQIAWRGPWFLAVTVLMGYLWCTPLYSFIEGCGQVRAVSKMRFMQALAAITCAWPALILHHGLYSPALVALGQTVVGGVFLMQNRRLLSGLLLHRAGASTLQWGRDIWPFQWRIAISTVCSYFTVQILIPIIFAMRGAVDAGQMGMSLSITGYMATLALVWTSTKMTPFGNMIARREFASLDRLFQRTFMHSLIVFGIIGVITCGAAAILPSIAPRIAARIVSPILFAALMVSSAASCMIQSLAIFLRAFRNEPFLLQSLVVAFLTLGLSVLTVSRWGNGGVTLSCLVAMAGWGLPSAWHIFTRTRQRYLRHCDGAFSQCSASIHDGYSSLAFSDCLTPGHGKE